MGDNKGIFKGSHLLSDSTMRTWRDEAACKGMPADLFFPEGKQGQTININVLSRAKVICNSCPVQPECLEHGMSEPIGIWGGKTRRERNLLRKGV
jgi:WhiB family redox-sensing transcriptional regulator